jgi:hypothetical protein
MGGFIIGLLFTLVGSALAFAWAPNDPAAASGQPTAASTEGSPERQTAPSSEQQLGPAPEQRTARLSEGQVAPAPEQRTARSSEEQVALSPEQRTASEGPGKA